MGLVQVGQKSMEKSLAARGRRPWSALASPLMNDGDREGGWEPVGLSEMWPGSMAW